jgi:hypothetical protein
MPVSFEEVGIGADESITAEKPIFGVACESRPIAILCNEYVGGARSAPHQPPKCPVGEGISAGHRDIKVGGTIMSEEARDERCLLVGALIAKERK